MPHHHVRVKNAAKLRREASLSQQALAKKAGVSRCTVRRAEQNRYVRAKSAQAILMGLAKALRRSLDVERFIQNGGNRDF